MYILFKPYPLILTGTLSNTYAIINFLKYHITAGT